MKIIASMVIVASLYLLLVASAYAEDKDHSSDDFHRKKIQSFIDSPEAKKHPIITSYFKEIIDPELAASTTSKRLIKKIREAYGALPEDTEWMPINQEFGELISYLFYFKGEDRPLYEWLRLTGGFGTSFMYIVKDCRNKYPEKTLAYEMRVLASLIQNNRPLFTGSQISPARDTTEYLKQFIIDYGYENENASSFVLTYPFLWNSISWEKYFRPGDHQPFPRKISSKEEYYYDYYVKLIKDTPLMSGFVQNMEKFHSSEFSKLISDGKWKPSDDVGKENPDWK